MAIIINDYQSSGTGTAEVQFPRSKTRYKVKNSDSLPLDDLRRIITGDIEVFQPVSRRSVR